MIEGPGHVVKTTVEPTLSLEAFARSISFRLYQPMWKPKWFRSLSAQLMKCGLSFEILNTRVPSVNTAPRRALRSLLEIPRMSTYAIACVINYAVSQMNDDEAFVNVGVWHGFTLLAGMAGNDQKRCIGVDDFSQFGAPRLDFVARFETLRSSRHEFYGVDYERYFASVHRGRIGVYLYDGEHSYRNQLRALEVAEPFFSENCAVLVDDTNLEEPRRATLEFLSTSKHTYRVVLDCRTRKGRHPTWWNGVMLLRREGG